ncbi:hypothetical protein [Virgibacillus indicus]|nr:hypothetical protein [Virgibacillus indicus]
MMNKEKFIGMSPEERVQVVNKLLQNHDLKEISNLVKIPSSSFSKIMREGDYIYHKADKKYYPFIRSEEGRVKKSLSRDNDEIAFIERNVDTLKKVIKQFEEQGLLLLDKRIYSKDAKFINKSIRMNNDVYKQFTGFCEDFYPHLKTQDLIAQALIDAMIRYKPENEREQ